MKKKECPSCAMEIEAGSKHCPICNYEFTQPNRLFQVVAILLVIIMVLFMIF
ncbi:MAG: hypothetical protein RIG77_16900 [Cyclobacteriaceae bacterium]